MRHLSRSPSTSYSPFHATSLSPYPECSFKNCRANLPQLHIIFSFSSPLFFSHPTAFPFFHQIYMGILQLILSFTLFFLLQTLSHVFFHHCHVIFSLTFQNRAALSRGKKKSLNCTHVGFIHLLVCVCVCALSSENV